jgi:hypothetical protein
MHYSVNIEATITMNITFTALWHFVASLAIAETFAAATLDFANTAPLPNETGGR